MFKINRKQIIQITLIVAAISFYALGIIVFNKTNKVIAQQTTTEKTDKTDDFNQQEALAKLREQIKGREREPAGQVFKNIQLHKERPAGQLLAIMEMGYSRSLGVNCTHCHVPEKWEAEDKPTKQIAREMAAMTASINNQSLKSIKNLKSVNPVINCTTCHRGEIKPAINLTAAPQGVKQ